VKGRKSLLVSRYKVSKKERRELASRIALQVSEAAARLLEGDVEVARLRHQKFGGLIILKGVPAFFFYGERIYPTLLLIYRLGVDPGLPKVHVDEGAVPHVLNGADVMVPGITRVEGEVERGKEVLVVDPRGRVFAVGEALMTGEEIKEAGKGKAVKNVHYAGDDLWEIITKMF